MIDTAMTDVQILTIALAAVPTMLTVLVGILINNSRLNDLNSRISDLRDEMGSRFGDIGSRFGDMNSRFDRVDQRFDEMRDLWRAELHRVEEVLDARLKHIEERG